MKLSVLSINFIKTHLPVFAIAFTLFVLVIAAPAPADMGKKIIVLDAGHGGHDTGAVTAGEIYEKDVSLAFVRLLAETLKAQYNVRLTRSDDYWVDQVNRPALANYLEADLFLSFHTGASILRNPGGMLVSYFESAETFQHPSSNRWAAQPDDHNRLSDWNRVKPEYYEKSRYFAELLKTKLEAYDAQLQIDIQGMPIFVLEGADQPALMIEIGYITNPSDLRGLQNDERLRQYANAVNSALNAYFSGNLNL